MIHTHNQRLTESVPKVASSPEQLRKLDYQKQQREKLKEEIVRRFMTQETKAHKSHRERLVQEQ